MAEYYNLQLLTVISFLLNTAYCNLFGYYLLLAFLYRLSFLLISVCVSIMGSKLIVPLDLCVGLKVFCPLHC